MKIKINEKSMWWAILLIIVLIALIVFMVVHMKKVNQGNVGNTPSVISDSKININTSLLDEIEGDTTWCGTFQVVWNDLKEKIVKKDIVFFKQIPEVEHLNKKTFALSDISEDYIYATYGLKTLDRKAEIEKAIKDKFNEESRILDQLNWAGTPQTDEDYKKMGYKEYIAYSMLVKEFKFENKFDLIEDRIFINKNEEIKNADFFGIDDKSNKNLKDQVDVLYYTDNEYAVKIYTKENDELYLVYGSSKTTFSDIYSDMMKKSENYRGELVMSEDDRLLVPIMSFDINERIKKLIENGDGTKVFLDSDNDENWITDAIQCIEFNLDENGGKVRSEAVVTMAKNSAIMEPRGRFLYFNKPFVLFVKEADKKVPYFALNVENIENFQLIDEEETNEN